MVATLTPKNSRLLPRVGRMAKNAVVLAGDDIPVAKLEAFYEQMFPTRSNFLKRNWRWLYRTDDNKTIKSPIVVMKDDQIAGHVGTIPMTLRRGQDERTAILLCDIAVLAEFRGKAFGAFLLAEAMALCPMRIGFPNELSWKLVSKFGWQDQLHTVGLSLLLHPEQHPKIKAKTQGESATSLGVKALAAMGGLATRIVWQARTLSKAKLSVLPATADQLAVFYEKQPQTSLHVPRSREFLNWRILAHPGTEKHFLLSLPETAKKCCSAIARVVEESGCRRLHLLTLRIDPLEPRRLSDFFAGVVIWALAEEIDVISLVTSDPFVAGVARWWLPVLKQLRYAYHADDLSGEQFLSDAGHIWEYIDGDFDLTYTSSGPGEN